MTSFLADLPAIMHADGKHLTVLEPFVYFRKGHYIEDAAVKASLKTSYGTHIVIPKGFYCDGYSVPWIFQGIFPRFGKRVKCAILHDFLCTDAEAKIISRKVADDIFLEAMKEVKLNKAEAYLKYAAVRIYSFYRFLRYGEK